MVAVVTSVLTAASLFNGIAAAPAAQASSTPLLEFQRDAARASWVSGPGGNYFGVWQCPQGSLAVGVRGAESGGYVYNFGLVCRYVNLDTGTWGSYVYTATTHSGGSTELRCPDGRALVRVDVWTMSGYGYPIASETEPYCQYLDFGNVNATPRTIPVLTGSVDAAPVRYFGARHGSLYGRATCGTGKFVVAIDGRRGALLDGLGIYCGGFTARAASVSGVTLSGATQFGMPVTATPTATGGPTPSMTYQWYRCESADPTTQTSVPAAPECELITGATSNSYSPQITDTGKHLRVAATATNYFGSSTLVSATTPAPSVPAPSLDLADASDSGTSATDNHTNDVTPTIHLGQLVPTASVTLTATSGATSVSCTTFTAAGIPDDERGAPASGQCDLPTLSEGTWTLTTSQTYIPVGSQTPITSTTTSLPIVIDTTPPVINPIIVKYGTTTIADDGAIAAPLSNTFTLTTPTATDAHSGVTLTCSLDGGTFTTCPTSYRNLTAGSHTLTVKAVDKAGNISTRDHTWSVVPPLVIDLAAESDSGYSNTDNNTNDKSPTYNVTNLVDGALVTLTATKSTSTRTCSFVANLTAVPPVTSCTFSATHATRTDAGESSPSDFADGTWTVRGTQTFTPLSGSAVTSTASNTEYLYLDTVAPVVSGESIYSNGIGNFADGATVAGTLGWYYDPRVAYTDAAGYEWGGTCSVNGGPIQQLNSSTESCRITSATSGTHSAVFTRFDKAGNQSAPETVSWTVVNYPTLALAAASDTGSSSTDRLTSDNTPNMQLGDLAPGATVTVTATRAGYSPVVCTFTAPAAVAPATSSTGDCDLGTLADGAWSVTAKQTIGSTTRTTSATTVTIDTTRPVPTLPVIRAGTSSGAVIANDTATTQTTAWIGAVSTPAGATIQCKLDGVVVRCPTTNTSFPNLSTGIHTFEVIATDAAGNVGVSSTSWRVLGKPVVVLDPASDTGAFSNDRITRDNTPQINVSSLSGAGSTVTVTATKSGSASVSCTFVSTSTSGSCTLPTALDGTWSVSAVENLVMGASTVASSPSDPISVTVDTVAPSQPAASLAVNGSSITSGGVVQLGAGITTGSVTYVTAPSSEAGATIQCSLDGGPSATCPAGGLGTVPNGVHALSMTAVDLAGNESTSVIQWAQVEQITLGLDPSGNLTTTASGQALSNSRNQTVTLTGLAGSTPVTVTATNGSDTVTCTITTETAGSGSCDLAFPSDGTWVITAKDKDNIVMNGVGTSLIVDTTRPTLTASIFDPVVSQTVAGDLASSPTFRTSQTTLSLNASATDAIDSSVTITCSLDGGVTGPCPASLTNLTYGEHTLVVTATDDAGNTDISTMTWHVTAPPTVQLASVSDTGAANNDGITRDSTPTITVGNLGRDVDVVVTASKAGQPDVKCYIWHANESGSVPGSASCDLGTLIDGSWSVTATQMISGRPEWISPASQPAAVVIDTVPPTAPTSTFSNGISAGSITTQTSLSFISGPTSVDANSLTYTCELNGGSPAPCSTTTGLSAGTHSLRVAATDEAGNASSTSLSWTVLGPPSVALSAASDSGASSSDAITNVLSPSISVSNLIPGASVTVTAAKGGETVACSFVAGEPASPSDSSSTGECELPGLTSDGLWTIQAVQSLGGTPSAASSSASFTLDTQKPLLSGGIAASVNGASVGNGGGTESTSITFTLPAVDAGATRLCTIDSSPVTCPSAAAALTGFANGAHTLQVTDTDVAGNITTESFTWAVVGVPTVTLAPGSDSGALDRITNDETPEFSVGALVQGATVQVVATSATGVIVSCSFVVVDGATSCEMPPMADGQWAVKARQGFGTGWSAYGTASQTTSVTIDATAPSALAVNLTVGSTPLTFADGDETGSSSASVSVSTPVSTDAHAVTYTCALNGTSAGACSPAYSSLPSGVNHLVVTGTDVAGNTSSITKAWSVIAPPVVTLAMESDSGAVGDGITAEEVPTFNVANLMPGASVTVTASKAGQSPVTCTFTAPSAISPNVSSEGSCQLSGSISGLDWSISAVQTYTTTTQIPSDAVTITSAPSQSVELDVVQPHEVQISAPVSVSITEQTLSLESRSVPMAFLSVSLTSLSPSVCSINADGDVVLLTAGTCTLKGTAPGGDDGGGVFYDTGVRTVSFAVLAAQTVSTVPASTVVAANPGLAFSVPAATGGTRPQRPQNVGSGGQNGAATTVGLKPPPPTTGITVERIVGQDRARVVATVRQDVPGAPVRSVVFVVFDQDGRMIKQTAVSVERDQTVVEAVVPYSSDEYQVRTYTTNEAGVSNKAPIGANVLNQPTVLGKKKDGTPILFGKKIAKPVLFDPDSPELTAKSIKVLDGVVRYAAKNGGRVFITGFVRNQGGSVKDQKALSDARAEQVAMYLSKRGVDTWIRYNGYGAYRKGQGLPQDRRVEVRWSNEEIPGLEATKANAVYVTEQAGS